MIVRGLAPPLTKYRLNHIAMVGTNVFTGILLVELNHSQYPLRFAQYSALFAPPLALLGLFLMSFPSEFQTWSPWCKILLEWFYIIAPPNITLSRFWPSIGAQLLTFGIVMSPHLRRALSHSWLLFLGKISFPLYLLHGTFMRSILAWLLFALQDLQRVEEDGKQYMRYPQPGLLTFAIVVPIFITILISASYLWTVKVEPLFGWMTRKAEDVMFGKEDRSPILSSKQW